MTKVNACGRVQRRTLLERVRSHGFHIEHIGNLPAPFQDSITVVTRVRLSFAERILRDNLSEEEFNDGRTHVFCESCDREITEKPLFQLDAQPHRVGCIVKVAKQFLKDAAASHLKEGEG